MAWNAKTSAGVRGGAVVAGTVLAILVGFVALNALIGAAVRGARIDLTEDRLYTLSPGVRPLLRRLPEPVRLDLYYTAEAGRGIPAISTYAQRVREFLEELVRASDGKLTLRVIDPQPYSEAEDEAVAAGLARLSVDGSGRELTLGLVATNAVDQREAIPLLDPSKEPFLEHDVMRLVESVGRAKKAKVGLLTTLPMEGGFNPASPGTPTRPWQVLEQIRSFFEVVPVATTTTELPEGLDALMIVHPQRLSEPLLRSIDAYALKGGRILAFLDPLCEAQTASSPGLPDFGADRTSDLGTLPEAWGIDWTSGEVVADRTYAQQVQTRQRTGGLAVTDYLVWLGLHGDALDHDDPVTGRLAQVNVATIGAITARQDAPTTVSPLLTSSADSSLIESARVSLMPDPTALLASFRSSDERHLLGVRIEGMVRSAFASAAAAEASQAADADAAADAEGASEASETSATEAAKPADAEGETSNAPHAEPPAASLATPTASSPAAIIVIADADLLADDNWVIEERLGPISLGWRTIADNGALVVNALETLTGDEAMLTLRRRGRLARPFERVQEIRRQAEATYLAREQQLQDEIRAAEQKIGALQREKSPENRLILSPEQEKELERLEQEVLTARRELRQVQFGLRSAYESLGRRLMVVNVVAWPLMVALFAVAWSLRRGARRGGAR